METTIAVDIIEAGSILVSSWGYDQTNIDFYLCTKRSGDWATIIPVGSKIDNAAESVEYVVADTENILGAPLRRKVRNYGNGDSVNAACNWMSARVWSGQARSQTAQGWGH